MNKYSQYFIQYENSRYGDTVFLSTCNPVMIV